MAGLRKWLRAPRRPAVWAALVVGAAVAARVAGPVDLVLYAALVIALAGAPAIGRRLPAGRLGPGWRTFLAVVGINVALGAVLWLPAGLGLAGRPAAGFARASLTSLQAMQAAAPGNAYVDLWLAYRARKDGSPLTAGATAAAAELAPTPYSLGLACSAGVTIEQNLDWCLTETYLYPGSAAAWGNAGAAFLGASAGQPENAGVAVFADARALVLPGGGRSKAGLTAAVRGDLAVYRQQLWSGGGAK